MASTNQFFVIVVPIITESTKWSRLGRARYIPYIVRNINKSLRMYRFHTNVEFQTNFIDSLS